MSLTGTFSLKNLLEVKTVRVGLGEDGRSKRPQLYMFDWLFDLLHVQIWYSKYNVEFYLF